MRTMRAISLKNPCSFFELKYSQINISTMKNTELKLQGLFFYTRL
jgi:hypothetical protein